MSKKKIIIIIVFVIVIIGVIAYNNNKTTNALNAAGDNSNGSYLNNAKDEKTGEINPQTKQSYSASWYKQKAEELYDLSDGTTDAAEEAKIQKIIAECKTYQDVVLLADAYKQVDSWTLTKMVYYELDGKGQIDELNAMLKKNGCSYQF